MVLSETRVCCQTRKLLPLSVWCPRGGLLWRCGPTDRPVIPFHTATSRQLCSLDGSNQGLSQRLVRPPVLQACLQDQHNTALAAAAMLHACMLSVAHANGCNIYNTKMQGLDAYKAKYAVDEVHYTEDMADVLARLQPSTLHLLCGINTDRCCVLTCSLPSLCLALRCLTILLFMT